MKAIRGSVLFRRLALGATLLKAVRALGIAGIDVPIDPPPGPDEADLEVTQSVTASPIDVTGTTVLTVTIENKGPKASTGIVMENTRPAGLGLAAVVPSGGTVFAPLTGQWTIPNLAAGAKVTLQFTLRADLAGLFTNVAEIKALLPKDPILANNRAEAVIVVNGFSICGIARTCNNITNQPNANAIVRVDGPVKTSVRADALGAFCIRDLPPGKYKVIVTAADPASGVAEYSEDIDLAAPGAVINAYSPWLVVTGRVTLGTNGPPVAGVAIEAVAGMEKVSATTDANGNYLIKPLGKKAYTVAPVGLPAGLVAKPDKVEIDPSTDFFNCPPRAHFVLIGKLRISGVVRACNNRGQPLPSTVVTLASNNPRITQSVRTGANGAYFFGQLPPGRYTITLAHPTHSFARSPLNVTLDTKDAVENFVGDPGMALGGRVTQANGQPFPAVDIEILEFRPPGQPFRRTVTTDVHGEFVLNGLPQAQYRVTPLPPEPAVKFTPAFGAFFLNGNGVAGVNCGNFLPFKASLNAAEIVALEAVQVIQDWQNNVPLVSGKATLVRAFLKPRGTNTTPVALGDPRLRIERDGRLVGVFAPDNAGVTARADYAARRHSPDTSLQYRLPAAALTGTNQLTLEWSRGVLTTATLPGQTAVRNNSTEIRFTPMPPVPIHWILVNWKLDANGKKSSEALASSQRSRILAGLPTATVTPVSGNTRTFDWTPANDPTDGSNDEDMSLSAALLRSLIRLKRGNPLHDGTKIIYHGVLDGTDLRGAGDIAGGHASFADPSAKPEIRRNLPLHEIGHALGRHHAVHAAFGIKIVQKAPMKQGLCEEVAEAVAPEYPMDALGSDLLAPVLGPMRLGDFRFAYGWDAGRNVYVSPFHTADIMSYCGTFGREFKTDWKWPGIFSYLGMRDAVQAKFGRAIAPRVLRAARLAGDPVLVVQAGGMLDGDGVVTELDPFTFRNEEWVASAKGIFSLQLRDASGILLASQSFEPTPISPDLSASAPRYFREFFVSVPWVAGTATIEIRQGNVPLAVRTVSHHAPAVAWLVPSDPDTIELAESGMALAWSMSDADGDPLLSRLEISDDGQAWSAFALDLPGTSHSLRPDHFGKGGLYRIRVVTSDGVHSAATELPARVLVPNRPPQIEVTQPSADLTFDSAAAIELVAEAHDPEQGLLPEIHWAGDRAGDLGTGSSILLEPGRLAPGVHTLSARVTDSGGLASEARVRVTVTAPEPPVLRVVQTESALELRWPVAAAGFSLQSAYELVGNTWFDVEIEPVVEGDDLVVRIFDTADEEAERFYRLSQ